MAPQSLAQLAHGPMGRELLDELMADLSTVIVTPGSGPFDATYFADLFGQEPRLEASWSYEAHGPLEPRPRPAVRLEHREAYFTPTQISELNPRDALVTVTSGRTAYPHHRAARRPPRGDPRVPARPPPYVAEPQGRRQPPRRPRRTRLPGPRPDYRPRRPVCRRRVLRDGRCHGSGLLARDKRCQSDGGDSRP
jgi:hypothetical protein